MKQTKRTKRSQHEQGFTLIELMVSLSLFVIVVLAAVASLYTVTNAAKKVQAMRTSLDNLNFAIESMSRTIRTGTDVGCNEIPHSTTCTLAGLSPAAGIILKSTLGFKGYVQYQRCDGCNSNGTTSIQKWEQGGDWVALTSPEIDIQNLQFYVDGADPADGEQPSVIIFMQGNATAGGTVAPFAIQTYVSQRTFE